MKQLARWIICAFIGLQTVARADVAITKLRVMEVQSYLKKLEEHGFRVALEKGRSLVFEQDNTNLKLQVIGTGGNVTNIDLPNMGSPLNFNAIIRSKKSQVSWISQDRLITVDTNTYKLVSSCSRASAGLNPSLVSIGDSLFAVESQANNDSLNIVRYKVAPDGSCRTDLIAHGLLAGSDSCYRAYAVKDQIQIFARGSLKGARTGTDLLRTLNLSSADGHVTAENMHLNLTLPMDTTTLSPAAAVSKKGTLVVLTKPNDPARVRTLFLSNSDGSLNPILDHVEDAIWTSRGDILINEGSHANSSALVLLKGPSFTSRTIIPQAVGRKDQIELLPDGNVSFRTSVRYGPLRYDRFDPEHPTASGKSDTDLKDLELLKEPRLPVSDEISYAVAGRKLPGLLHHIGGTKNGACSPGVMKTPAIVFVHGGGGNNPANGEEPDFSGDALALSQLGYPVLEAGYSSDLYEGRDYTTEPIAYVERDYLNHSLDDIVGAANYLKSMPCIEPNKIILVGHSFGAIIGSLIATLPKYKSDPPFAAFVLRGGLYTKESLLDSLPSHMRQDRLVTQGSDEDRITLLDQAESHCLKVYEPTVPVHDFSEALKILNQLNRSGQSIYGVRYTLPESFYDRTVAIRNVSTATKKPIFLFQGSDDNLAQAQEFEAALKAHSANVTSWYPKDAGHYFRGEPQKEMCARIEKIIAGLPLQEN